LLLLVLALGTIGEDGGNDRVEPVFYYAEAIAQL
jgi:hypothetical protein